MIDFKGVYKNFGTQTVLSDASFRINAGERIGIVGPNGAGKSTIVNLIVGGITPDKGQVTIPVHCRLGYVHQQLNPHAVAVNLVEYVENAQPELHAIEAEIHAIEEQMRGTEEALRAPLLRRIGDLQSRFETMGGYVCRHRAEQALSGLGFPEEQFTQPFKALSGGWQSRAELARIIVAEPDILLLDEPSNYLDTPTVEWLQKYLRKYAGTLVLISHDRYLLNSLTTVTIEIANARAERYPGNYDHYARERVLRYDQRLAAQKNQDRKREQVERFVERFRAKNTKASQVQSRLKQLERMEEIALPRRIRSPGHIRLRPPPHCGVEVVRLEDAGLTYDGQRWILRNFDLRVMRGEKIAFVGYNGMGKTTLLRVLAGSLPLSTGKRVAGHAVSIGYQSQDFAETMDPERTVFETVKGVAPDVADQEVRDLLGGFGFSGDAIDKPVLVLSGGEKIRLSLARLLVKPPNLLILDEPTTHLDIQAREALEKALRGYSGTICLVSHDVDFVRHVAGHIVSITRAGITRYPGGYDYYREKTADDDGDGKKTGDRLPVIGNQKTGNSEQLSVSSGTRGVPDKKELRKQRAAARQEMYNKTKDLKKEILRLESRIEECESARTYLLAQLNGDPAKLDFAALNKQLKKQEDDIGDYTKRWDAATEALEAIVKGDEVEGG